MNRVKRMHVTAVFAVIVSIISGQAFAECGVASYYTMGHTTANGEAYNHRGISAAHKSLPFGTRVRVTHKGTGRSITVRINDRGPFVRGRIIDLSSGARGALGMGGLAPVCLEVVSWGNGARYASRRARGVRLASSRKARGVRVASRGAKAVRVASYRGKRVRVASRHTVRYTKLSRRQQRLEGRLLRRESRRYAQVRAKRVRSSEDDL